MKSVSRTRTVYINSVVTLLSQILQVILGFVIRKLFLTYIGVEYLGYNSVFLNILQLLNLADLGIGVAVTSFLYKPLATNNTNAISALMYIYKRLYTIIGIFVLVIGLAIIPFLSILVPDAKCSFGYLVLIYLINLAGTVSTYFLAYKRTLIIADQKSYIANITDTILFFVAAVLQLIGMKLFPSYVVFILINLLRNIISNIVLSLRADHIYGRLYRNVDKSYVKEYQPQIFAYIKDVFISRIGAVIYYSTDNVILSVIRGSLLTGYLSNYTLITTQLNTVVVQILSSLQATFGNYISMNEDVDEQCKMADNYFCANYIIGNFCFICFSLLVQPFIELVFGAGMLLGFSTALWLGINLMLTFLIQLPSQVFTIYKLFRYDRFIILISATLNILISIVLGKKIGLNGVLIGTFVTSLIYLFSRFFVISKYVYKISYLHYIKKILFYGLSSVISFSVSFFVLKNFKGIAQYGVTGFGFKTILVAIMSILSTVMLLCKTREMDFLISKVTHDKFSASKVKLMVVFSTIIIVILSIIRGQLSNNYRVGI